MARKEYFEYLLSKHAIDSASISEIIENESSCIELSEENKELWKYLANADKLDENCLQTLSKTDKGQNVISWLFTEGYPIKPTQQLFKGFIEKDDIDNVKKVGDILGNSITISCKILCLSKSLEMSNFLKSFMETFSKPIEFEQDDLFTIANTKPFNQYLFDKALESGILTTTKVKRVNLFGYSISKGCIPIVDYLITNEKVIIDDNPAQDIYRILKSEICDDIQVKYLNVLFKDLKMETNNLLSKSIKIDDELVKLKPLYEVIVDCSFPVFDYLTTQIFQGKLDNPSLDLQKDYSVLLLRCKYYGNLQQLEKLYSLSNRYACKTMGHEFGTIGRGAFFCNTPARNIPFIAKYFWFPRAYDLLSDSEFVREDTLQAMINLNIDINKTEDGDEPIIHRAIMEGRVLAVRVLLKNNVDLSQKDSKNVTVQQCLENAKSTIHSKAFMQISNMLSNSKLV